jgi:hypothetical protein
MFVPVCDRPSVARPTGPRVRTVMETRSTAIHRKMPAPPLQLPITGSAHKAAVIGDERVRAPLAARDMAAKGCRAAALDGRHHLQLVETDVTGIGTTPCRSVVAKNIRDLQRQTAHSRRRLGRRRHFLAALRSFPELLVLAAPRNSQASSDLSHHPRP